MMTRLRAITIAAVISIHHILAVYSVSAERFSLPLVGIASGIIFPAVLIVNALPLALASGLGALADGLIGNDPLTKFLFIVAFIFMSTVQWGLVGMLVSSVITTIRGRSAP